MWDFKNVGIIINETNFLTNQSHKMKNQITSLLILKVHFFVQNAFVMLTMLVFTLGTQAQYGPDPNDRCLDFTMVTPQFQDCQNLSTLSPAEFIYYAAQENNVNPVLLIAKLQDEQSLITNTPTDLEWKLKRATGYGMSDIGDAPHYYGFFPQIVGCAYQFRLYRDNYGYSFQQAYQTYTTWSYGYTNFTSNLYPVYADRMNTIANTNYSLYPSSYGYYNDFKNQVSIADIQALLNYFGGPLMDENLFNFTVPFSLNSGESNLFWPFKYSEFISQDGSPDNPAQWSLGTNGWHIECGPGCNYHLGSDYYADDWNISGTADCYEDFLSPLSGTVIYADYLSLNNGYGKQVIIRSDDNDDYAFRVAHFENISVSVGDDVVIGTKLGEVGNTGSSSGCHAHCVLYKNITQNYSSSQTGLDRLQLGYNLGVSGGPTPFAAPYYFDARGTLTPNSIPNSPPDQPIVVIPPIIYTNVAVPITAILGSDPDGDDVKVQIALSQGYVSSSGGSVFDSGLQSSPNLSFTTDFTFTVSGLQFIYATCFDENGNASGTVAKEVWVNNAPTGLCYPPSNINTYPTATTAFFNWSGVGVHYQIAIAPYGTNNWWFSGQLPNNYGNFNGFTPNTTYHLAVRSYCGSNWTNWTIVEFTTAAAKTDSNEPQIGYRYTDQTKETDLENLPNPRLENVTNAQVFPNPVTSNQDINLEFTVTEQQDELDINNSTIEIYDIIGRKVDIVNLTDAHIGHNKIQYNTANLSNGIYICQFNINNQSEIVRFTVNK